MNSKEFDQIKVNHSDNIVINIKQANKNLVNNLLPGYTKESCSN